MHKVNLNVHALPGQRQIVNIRADRAGKHTVLTFCPVLKKTKLPAGVTATLPSVVEFTSAGRPRLVLIGSPQ